MHVLFVCSFRSQLRPKWGPSLAPAVPFSPISPSLTLMNPLHNSFWSRALPQTPPPTPPSEEIFSTPNASIVEIDTNNLANDTGVYSTPLLQTQFSNCSVNSDIFGTPDSTLDSDDVFKSVELRKSTNNPTDNKANMSTITEHVSTEGSKFVSKTTERSSLREKKKVNKIAHEGVMRSKSDYEIPIKNKSCVFLQNLQQNIMKLSPSSRRRIQSTNSNKHDMGNGKQSTPNSSKSSGVFKLPGSPILNNHSQGNCGTRAISLNSLRHSSGEQTQHSNAQQTRFVLWNKIFIGNM